MCVQSVQISTIEIRYIAICPTLHVRAASGQRARPAGFCIRMVSDSCASCQQLHYAIGRMDRRTQSTDETGASDTLLRTSTCRLKNNYRRKTRVQRYGIFRVSGILRLTSQSPLFVSSQKALPRKRIKGEGVRSRFCITLPHSLPSWAFSRLSSLLLAAPLCYIGIPFAAGLSLLCRTVRPISAACLLLTFCLRQ